MTMLTRPDGRLYRPRTSALLTVPWTNAGQSTPYAEGVIVIGTHDLVRAQHFADADCRTWYGVSATEPRLDWVRRGYGKLGDDWIADEVRGRPAIWFTARA